MQLAAYLKTQTDELVQAWNKENSDANKAGARTELSKEFVVELRQWTKTNGAHERTELVVKLDTYNFCSRTLMQETETVITDRDIDLSLKYRSTVNSRSPT